MSSSWLEPLLMAIFVLLVLNAARRGFVREGSLLLGLALALFAAGRLYRWIGGLFLVEDGAPWLVVIYLVLTLGLLIIAGALSGLAAPLVRRHPGRSLDRLAGLIVGLGEATLAVALLALVADRAGLVRIAPGSLTARAVDLASLGLAWLSATVPPELVAR